MNRALPLLCTPLLSLLIAGCAEGTQRETPAQEADAATPDSGSAGEPDSEAPDGDDPGDVGAPDAPEGGPCGGATCGPEEYCHEDRCQPMPTLSIETATGSRCVDLAPARPAPEFTWRRTIQGRPGATAIQHNTHITCPDEEPPTPGRFELDAQGRFSDSHSPEETIEDCADGSLGGFYGTWEAVIEVDGQRSEVVTLTYFNSSCPEVGSCALAANFCLP